jgi:Na+-driven multidrug efflux pump
MEWWQWEVQLLMAGRAGTVQLAAEAVIFQIFTFYFVIGPMGISQAVTMRVGNLVGAQQLTEASAAFPPTEHLPRN